VVIDPAQGDVAQQLAELTDGHGADVAFDCVGTQDSLDAAINLVRKGGRITVVGVFKTPPTVDSGTLWLQSGAGRWPVRSVEIEHGVEGDGSRCRATVRRDGQLVGAFSYSNPREDPGALLDPTFDETDAELADFFLWLARSTRRPGWIDNVASIWQAGIR
jgi:hypothetical protein